MRPNVLMFNDYGWLEERAKEQRARFVEFTENFTYSLADKAERRSHVMRNSMAIVEMGAGLAVPTIRRTGEAYLKNSKKHFATLVRINREDFDCDLPEDVLRISEGNVDKFPEAEDDPEKFMKSLPKLAEEDEDRHIPRQCAIIEIKAGALEGVKAIYDVIKRYCSSAA